MNIAVLGNIYSGTYLHAETLATENSLTLQESSLLKYTQIEGGSLIPDNLNLEEIQGLEGSVVSANFEEFMHSETDEIAEEINANFDLYFIKVPLEEWLLDVIINKEHRTNQSLVEKADMVSFVATSDSGDFGTEYITKMLEIARMFTSDKTYINYSDFFTEEATAEKKAWQESVISNVSDVKDFISNTLVPLVNANSDVSIFE